ncbi:hypothetical protein [Amycolatopsis plumensis]|uniref:Uncharacterized protein n=1 Tax=Amycolatopsis plumensis TaxID=236508 RepID=A0ABV5UBA8_9PSEU
MTAREELVRAVGEAVFAEVKKFPPPAYLPGAIVPMGASVEDVGRAALAVVDEELAVLRAKVTLSPEQVEAKDQEIAELKQEHGVLSGQLHEIRSALAACDADRAVPLEYLADTVRAVLRDAPAPPAPAGPRVFFPGDTVPSGVCVVSKSGLDSGAHFTTDGEWTIPAGLSPYVEVPMPTAAELDAAVDLARDARADAEWQHTKGTNP